MKNALIAILFVFASAHASAAQIRIGFVVWNGPVTPFNPQPESLLGQANEAFLAKYSAEAGVIGTAQGVQGSLTILVANPRASREIWRKMLAAGDAFNAGSGVGYFRFQDGYTPNPLPQYVYVGKRSMEEGTQSAFIIPNGTPEITGFMVAMEEKCVMGRAGVIVANGMPVQPTKLIKSSRIGSYTIGYEYSVNGGAGALISQINVSLGSKHPYGFIVDICPVDLYVRY